MSMKLNQVVYLIKYISVQDDAYKFKLLKSIVINMIYLCYENFRH